MPRPLMNPTEIYDALAEIAAEPFDATEFPFAFAAATDGAKAAISGFSRVVATVSAISVSSVLP
jgi:hypothetical protein